MTRTIIPLSDCGLLSRKNARRYCGCLGEERFDREVGPYVRPKLIGGERFYSRRELDAWIAGPEKPASPVNVSEWISQQLEADFKSRGPRRRRQSE